MKEKQTQVSLALARARHLTNDFTTALVDGMENSSLRVHFSQLQVNTLTAAFNVCTVCTKKLILSFLKNIHLLNIL